MTYSSLHAKAQAAFNPAPSIGGARKSLFKAAKSIPDTATCVAAPVTEDGDVPSVLGVDREALTAAGFRGRTGEVLVIPRAKGPAIVAVGIGGSGKLTMNDARDAAAAFARATSEHARLAFMVPEWSGATEAIAQAIAEGVMLARYRYVPLKAAEGRPTELEELALVSSGSLDDLETGLERGGVTSRATELARDLANAPAVLLTARRMAELAESLAEEAGLEIEVFDQDRLSELGCGGILGVNAGSAEPPRLIKLTYHPGSAMNGGHVALVAKGVMYDSGGISLKPGDEVHAQMKNDMSGAGASLAAMTALKALDCRTTVTAFLMCTDNMPSGTAMKLGDVLTVRGGKTVEVINTDAEGRLVMSDGFVLATELERKPDAIVDIATLTGAAMRALGTQNAAVLGNHPQLLEQVKTAAQRTDETVWELPLDRRLRKELDSDVADLKNLGGANAGTITAALFLEEFVAGIPWAHIDMCGTAYSDRDASWRSKGMTGYGARLLLDFLVNFKKPAALH